MGGSLWHGYGKETGHPPIGATAAYISEQGTGEKIISNNASVLIQVTNDLSNVMQDAAAQGERGTLKNYTWVMSPAAERFLLTIRDNLGNYAFRSEMSVGVLLNYPYVVAKGPDFSRKDWEWDVSEVKFVPVPGSALREYYDGADVQLTPVLPTGGFLMPSSLHMYEQRALMGFLNNGGERSEDIKLA